MQDVNVIYRHFSILTVWYFLQLLLVGFVSQKCVLFLINNVKQFERSEPKTNHEQTGNMQESRALYYYNKINL